MSKANGEGSVYWDEKRKVWIARYSYWHNGKLKRPSFSSKVGKVDALEKMHKARMERGDSPMEVEKLKVGQYLTTWLRDSVKTGVSPATYHRYEQDVKLHLTPALGRILLTKLKAGHIEGLKNQLLEKGLAPGTINQALTTLSIALNRAVKWEYLTRNPGKAVGKVRDTATGLDCLSEEEAGRLIEVVKGTKREALYQVALKCGLRQGEILALKWEDLIGNELAVRNSVNTHPSVPVWGSTKTGAQRVITLPPSLLDSLARHRAFQNAEKMSKRLQWRDEGLMFPNELGGVQRAYGVLYRLRKDLGVAGLPRIRFHDLRDTAATLLLSHQTPLHVVSRMLGHTDPAMTLRRYSHVLPDAREAAARTMQDYSF